MDREPIVFPGVRIALVPFPGLPHPDIDVAVEVSLPAPDLLRLWFVFGCDQEDLRVPAPATPERAAGLWRHLCAELFAREADQERYAELNFSPSGQWAAYRFDSHRTGMADLPLAPPAITTASIAGKFALGADVDLAGLPLDWTWRIGLSAVVEDRDGLISYWALVHPPGEPDFHHADCFALGLPAAPAA
jgi:hypothetical protein